MELSVWTGLCVLLFPQIVSAGMFKRTVPGIDCDNFSDIMQEAKVCTNQQDNRILASGFVLESDDHEVLVYLTCRALPEIINCVKVKYGSCLNIDNIVGAFVDDDICQGGRPNEWLRDWWNHNPLVDITDNCAGEIKMCTKQDWILEYMGSEFENLRLNEKSTFLWEYKTRIEECIKPLFEDAGAVCSSFRYSIMKTMIGIQVTRMPLQVLTDKMEK